MAVDTRYAISDGIHIAFQIVGEGPPDLILVPEFWHSIEAQWDEPSLAAFLHRLESFARLICLDQRGTGLSDPVALEDLPSLDGWMDDIRAVMDDAGVGKAALLGIGGGGALSALFAAGNPGRVTALVLVNSFARYLEADDYPCGASAAAEQQLVQMMHAGWGRGVLLELLAPSRVGDQVFREWWARYQRLGWSPGAMLAVRRMLAELDVRGVLESVQAPTLVIHRADNLSISVGHGRYLAEHIPGARYLELPGTDYFPFLGDATAVLDAIEEFVTGVRPDATSNRVLSTVLFTDLVGSTEHAAELGDRAWADLLEHHHAAVRQALDRYRGREVDTAGDGFFATFDGPARAVRCALQLRDTLLSLGLEVRAGVHTGEVELRSDGVRGVAVHIGSRIAARAESGEVLVSSTVKDLVAGSGIGFADRGAHDLEGVPGRWRLFAAKR